MTFWLLTTILCTVCTPFTLVHNELLSLWWGLDVRSGIMLILWHQSWQVIQWNLWTADTMRGQNSCLGLVSRRCPFTKRKGLVRRRYSSCSFPQKSWGTWIFKFAAAACKREQQPCLLGSQAQSELHAAHVQWLACHCSTPFLFVKGLARETGLGLDKLFPTYYSILIPRYKGHFDQNMCLLFLFFILNLCLLFQHNYPAHAQGRFCPLSVIVVYRRTHKNRQILRSRHPSDL